MEVDPQRKNMLLVDICQKVLQFPAIACIQQIFYFNIYFRGIIFFNIIRLL